MPAPPLLPALAMLAAAVQAPPPAMPASGQTAQAYDQQVRRDALSAEALQGPLDGGFVLTRPSGRALYAFELVDPGAGDAGLEGAWRKTVRRAQARDFGVVDVLAHDGPALVLRFDERPGRLVVVTVRPQGEGLWSGSLWRLGFTRPVVLRKLPF